MTTTRRRVERITGPLQDWQWQRIAAWMDLPPACPGSGRKKWKKKQLWAVCPECAITISYNNDGRIRRHPRGMRQWPNQRRPIRSKK